MNDAEGKKAAKAGVNTLTEAYDGMASDDEEDEGTYSAVAHTHAIDDPEIWDSDEDDEDKLKRREAEMDGIQVQLAGGKQWW